MRIRRWTAALLVACLFALPACGASEPGANEGAAPTDQTEPMPSVTTSVSAERSAPATPSPDSDAPEEDEAPAEKSADPDGSTEASGAPNTAAPESSPSKVVPDQEPVDSTSTEPIDSDADEDAQPTKKGKQEAVLNRVGEETPSECVLVGSLRDARSGEFVAGPFDNARETYGERQPGLSKRTVRLYFVPLNAKKMPGLSAEFTHVASGKTVTTRQNEVADAEQWKFYDTYTELRPGGTWRVRAVAGNDEGCFEFKLPKRP